MWAINPYMKFCRALRRNLTDNILSYARHFNNLIKKNGWFYNFVNMLCSIEVGVRRKLTDDILSCDSFQ